MLIHIYSSTHYSTHSCTHSHTHTPIHTPTHTNNTLNWKQSQIIIVLLSSEESVADYLRIVTGKTLRTSQHQLTKETGTYKQSWLHKLHKATTTMQNQTEQEPHFLTDTDWHRAALPDWDRATTQTFHFYKLSKVHITVSILCDSIHS